MGKRYRIVRREIGTSKEFSFMGERYKVMETETETSKKLSETSKDKVVRLNESWYNSLNFDIALIFVPLSAGLIVEGISIHPDVPGPNGVGMLIVGIGFKLWLCKCLAHMVYDGVIKAKRKERQRIRRQV